MYRVKSNAVWHSLPGVVAAYQPIAAPNPFAARQNVAHQGARFGVYTAIPGVLPTWSAANGWSFVSASGHYLTTGFVCPQNGTWLLRYNAFTPATARISIGARTASLNGMFVEMGTVSGTTGAFVNGALTGYANWGSSGVIGMASKECYHNGVSVATIGAGTNNTTQPLYIGALNNNGTPLAGYYWQGNIQNVAIYSRTLSPAEMWLASRQMAYCHVNPDWDAWSRRRRYYYAPSQAAAAAFNPAWARNANTVINQVHL